MRYLAAISAVALFLQSGAWNQDPLSAVPANAWTQIAQDQQGARRNSLFRYVNDQQYFLLWGFMGHVTSQYGHSEEPWAGNNEYDLVAFDPLKGKWESQYPQQKEKE